MNTKMLSKVFVNEDSLNDESDHLEVEEDTEIGDNEEEEEETRINSNGSVLMPSDAPYDKFIKIKEANNELFSTIISKPKCPCKVQFSPSVITHSIEYDDIMEEAILTEIDEDADVQLDEVDLNTSTESSNSDDHSNSTVISKPSKLLLVTVPTVFTEQLDDEGSESIDVNDYEDDDEQEEEEMTDAEIKVEEITDSKNIISDSHLDNNSNEEEDVEEEEEVEECVLEEDEEEELEENEDVEEEVQVIEDITDDCNIQPSPSQNLHKRALTKDARIEEEDTESDTDVQANSIDQESVDNLIENFKECIISTEDIEKNHYKDEEFNDDIISQTENVTSVLQQMKSNSLNKNNIEDTKRKNTHKNKIRLTENIRSQCPIYQRNYGLLSSMKTDKRNKLIESRPHTAPTKRHCCNYWDQGKLPEYNGLRSEYGLTAEQLMQRKRDKIELAKYSRMEKEQKYMEEIRKQKENDLIFNSWLVRKKKEAALKFSRKKLQSTFQFRTMAASTKHFDKVGALRKKLLKREQMSYSLEEFFKNANPHEQKTYRIYLGLCVE